MQQITLIAPTYLPSRRANTFQVMKMAAALADLGHEIRMIVPLPGGRHPDERPGWSELADHYGISAEFMIEWIPVSGRWRGYDYGLRAAARAQAVEPDLVYTRHVQAALAAALRGLPTILEIHDYPRSAVGSLLLRWFLRSDGARRIVAVSNALLADLSRGFRIPAGPFAIVEHDGVDLERFEDLPPPKRARADLDLPDRPTAGYTGHLYAGRGIETILGMARRSPEVQFLLAGGRESDLEQLRAEAAGLENVILAGFVPNALLPRYQAACDVLLMPYGKKVAASSGGDIGAYLSPMKLFEYLASGRPILSSSLPVLREVLDETTAVLLPPGDLAAWSQALADLLADPGRRKSLAEAGKALAQQHSWKARAERIVAGVG